MKMLQMEADANFHYLHALVAVPSLASPSFFAVRKHCSQGPAQNPEDLCFYVGRPWQYIQIHVFWKLYTYVSYVSYVYTHIRIGICHQLPNATVHKYSSMFFLPRTSSSATRCRRSSGCARPAALFQQAAVTRRGLSQQHPVYQDGTVTSPKPREIRFNK